MRKLFIATLLLCCVTAQASPLSDWSAKYGAASQALSAIAKKMLLGASNFGGWVSDHPDEAKKLADHLKKNPGAKLEETADKLGLESLSAIFGRQMTFPVFAEAFEGWAKKFPDAASALLTNKDAARAALPFYDEMNAPPPETVEEAAGQVLDNLEKLAKDRSEMYDSFKEMKAAPASAVSGELQKLFLDAARDHFSKYPYHKNEDNARNEVLAVFLKDKGWFVNLEDTDLWEDSLGRKHPMQHRTLNALVAVRHDKTQCMIFPDKVFERRQTPENNWGGPEYWANPVETQGWRIDCAKIKKQ